MRLDETATTGETINLRYAYVALTIDVMSEYCFSRPYDAVLMPDFNKRSADDLQVFLEMSLLVGQPYSGLGKTYSHERIPRLCKFHVPLVLSILYR